MYVKMNTAESGQQGSPCQILPQGTLQATVTRIGYYRDTLPKLVITVKKDKSLTIPFCEGERLPVPFIINGRTYTAGIRSTHRSETIMVSPDLYDSEHNPVRLADVLYDFGWDRSTTRIELCVEGGAVTCNVRLID